MAAKGKTIYYKKIDAGVCGRCKNPRHLHFSLCREHLVYSRIRRWAYVNPECAPFLPSKETPGRPRKGYQCPLFELSSTLIAKLEEQNYTCPISGRHIDFGLNAEIDHIIPIRERPDLAFEIDNLRWLDKSANASRNRGNLPSVARTPDAVLARRVVRLAASIPCDQIQDPLIADAYRSLVDHCKRLQQGPFVLL